jgi:hypothetical protein
VGHRFRTDPDERDRLWARLPRDAERIEVVMEPTRNAWVALADCCPVDGIVKLFENT